jgi:hypothetical protein
VPFVPCLDIHHCAALAAALMMTHCGKDVSREDDGELGAARCAEEPSRPGMPKMRFIHQRRHLEKDEVVQLDCDTQCNFMLLSDADYAAYQQLRRFSYNGGTFKHFPARITVPASGIWNIIIDLAGAKSEIHYNITVVVG